MIEKISQNMAKRLAEKFTDESVRKAAIVALAPLLVQIENPRMTPVQTKYIAYFLYKLVDTVESLPKFKDVLKVCESLIEKWVASLNKNTQFVYPIVMFINSLPSDPSKRSEAENTVLDVASALVALDVNTVLDKIKELNSSPKRARSEDNVATPPASHKKARGGPARPASVDSLVEVDENRPATPVNVTTSDRVIGSDSIHPKKKWEALHLLEELLRTAESQTKSGAAPAPVLRASPSVG